MNEATQATRIDLETLISSIDKQLQSNFIKGAERRQLEAFRRTLEHQLFDLEKH